MQKLLQGRSVLLPADYEPPGHAVLLYIEKGNDQPAHKLHFIETYLQGQQSAFPKEIVKEVTTKNPNMGNLVSPDEIKERLLAHGIIEPQSAYKLGREDLGPRIFTVNTASCNFQEHDQIEATEALSAVVKHVVEHNSLIQGFTEKFEALKFFSANWAVSPQRLLRPQIPKTENSCEFSSIRAFCAKFFSHELMLQVVERAMAKHSLVALEAKNKTMAGEAQISTAIIEEAEAEKRSENHVLTREKRHALTRKESEERRKLYLATAEIRENEKTKKALFERLGNNNIRVRRTLKLVTELLEEEQTDPGL